MFSNNKPLIPRLTILGLRFGGMEHVVGGACGQCGAKVGMLDPVKPATQRQSYVFALGF